jgi:hypothetical protein
MVEVDKCTHDKLAVHAVADTSVPRNGVPEVLDLDRPLDARGKEPSEGADGAGEEGAQHEMTLQLRDDHWPELEDLADGEVTAFEFEGHEVEGGAGAEGARHALDGLRQLGRGKGTMIEKRQVLMAPPM